MSKILRYFLLAWGLALVASCADPVPQMQIDALGPEDPAVLPGALHRPGQPCLYCHGDSGFAPRFTVAGTIYRTPAAAQVVGGVEVQLFDSSHRAYVTYTNCAGNFFVSPQEFQPIFPLWVSIVSAGQGLDNDMESPMNKDGNCGSCHQPTKSPMSAGIVFLSDDPAVADKVPGVCGERSP